MLNRLRDKRGAVMESALLFLLVIFLLCFLLTLVALSGHTETKLAEIRLENRLALDSIADGFIAYAKTNPDTGATPFDDQNDTYLSTAAKDGDAYVLTVTVTDPPRLDPAAVLLTVKVDAAGRILAYCYGATTETP